METDERMFGECQRANSTLYLPTPEEIAQATAEIREGWDDQEELSRRTGPNKRVEYKLPGSDQYGISEGWIISSKSQTALTELNKSGALGPKSTFWPGRPRQEQPTKDDE